MEILLILGKINEVFYIQTKVVTFMNYPNGKPFKRNKSQVRRTKDDESSKIDHGGRGMSLESDLEQSNAHYLRNNIAAVSYTHLRAHET